MKKLVLSVMAVAAFGFAANAQEKEKPTYGFQESNVFVEGSFSISDSNVKMTGTDTKVKTTTFEVNPKVGYMLNDKFAVGASVGFGKLGLDNELFDGAFDGVDADYIKSTYAGVFARYYFLEVGQRFKTFAEVGVGFSEGKMDVSGVSNKATGIRAGLDLGFNYFLTQNLAVSFNVANVFSYANYNVKEDGKKTNTVSNTNANVNIFNNFFDNAKFGLTYKF
ncbi:outer membrane beta-barrel protein [Myroides phaeus]|uniref:Outer membrane protein n=1 Tax=Myroides phaeus TaxID=702745 RepID=A0A1G8EU03_9FLAO|nr:outer membrane beta-barrel protein [Myroides phaeus]SDH73366.1 outer membrane protein [Myroides phaeus]